MASVNIHGVKSHLTKKLAKKGVLKIYFLEALMIKINLFYGKVELKKRD